MRTLACVMSLFALVAMFSPSRARAETVQECAASCLRNYGCGPGYPRGPNDMSCAAWAHGCRTSCERRLHH